MLGIINHGIKPGSRYRVSETSTTFTDSDSDYISVANHADLQVDGEDFSVAFWINLTEDATSTSDKDGYIGLKAGKFRGGGFWFEYKDDAGDDQHISFFTSNTGSKSECPSVGDAIAYDTWYHVAVTYDLSTTTARLYLNGVLNKTNAEQTAPTAYTDPVFLGASNVGSAFVSSLHNDIALWKGVVLSVDDILLLAEQSVDSEGIGHDYLKGFWRLDQDSATGSGNVVNELGSNHGTSSGLADSNFDTTDTPIGV